MLNLEGVQVDLIFLNLNIIILKVLVYIMNFRIILIVLIDRLIVWIHEVIKMQV